MFAQPIYESMTPFEWVSTHLQLVGWPVLIFIAWQCRGFADRFMHQWVAMDERSKVTLSMVADVKLQTDTMANNHLKHMETDMTKQTVLLESIDKNIAILVDRPRVA